MESRRSGCYSDSFWDKDINSTEGFDRLQKHMKEGKVTCEVAEKLIKARAKADEEYAKALQKIKKSTGETTELGSLKTSLECLRNELDKMGQTLSESATHLNEIALKISEFHGKQKISRKKLEDSIIKVGKDKSSQHRRAMEARRLYFNKSQEANTAEANVKKAKVDDNCSEKDFERMSNKFVETKQAANRAENDYREAVAQLTETKQRWERDMSEYCRLCEEWDETRLEFLREQLWQTCNIISANSLDTDMKCEIVRNSLENVDIGSDMTSFVTRASTGSERPDPIIFEQFNLSDGRT